MVLLLFVISEINLYWHKASHHFDSGKEKNELTNYSSIGKILPFEMDANTIHQMAAH